MRRVRQNFAWLLSFALFISIQTGCSSETAKPFPEESQSGKDIIACRIDGNIWLPRYVYRDFKSGSLVSIARYSEKIKTLYVGGINQEDWREIGFSLINCTGVGTYQLDNVVVDGLRPTVSGGEFSPGGYISDKTYWTDADHKGEVTITKLSDGIGAGRFSFRAFNAKTGKIVTITDGRFDFHYSPGIDE